MPPLAHLADLPILASSPPADDTSVGLGSCGELHQNSEYTVALNAHDMNAFGGGWPSPACGKQVSITYNGKTVQAVIKDTCPTCPPGGLDLSEGLFGALAAHSEGVIYADWSYGGSAPAPAPAPEPTTTWKPEPTTTWKAAEPTTTWAPEPTTTSAAAPAWTPAAEEKKESTPAAAAAPAAEESSAPLFVGTWAEHVQAMTCPNDTLILWNNTEVIFNGTYSTELNGTNTLSGNSSSTLINNLLPNVTEICFAGNFSEFNATAFQLAHEVNATAANATVLFNLFAVNSTASFF